MSSAAVQLAPVAPPARARDGGLIALGLLALYVALAQGTFYKVDGQALIELSSNGWVHHPYHHFYLGELWLLRSACEPLGLGIYRTACLLSALGTATGVLLIHGATRVLGLARPTCNLTALAFGLSPGVMFYATIVEVHGPFLPFAGGAALALAWCGKTLQWRAAVVAGLSLTLAYLAHPSGALMGALLPSLAWSAADGALPGPRLVRWRALAISCAVAAASALAAIAVLPAVLQRLAGLLVDPLATAGGWQNFGTGRLVDPLLTLRTLSLEWVLPALPMSLVALAGLLRRRTRTGAVLLGLGVLPYVLSAQLMLAGYTERGAYLLPALWPTALVALSLLTGQRKLVMVMLGLAAGLGIGQVKEHDHPERARAFAEGVAQIARGAPVFLVTGDEYDYAARVMYMPTTPQYFLTLAVGQSPDAMQASLSSFDAEVGRMLRQGWCVLVTEAARAGLNLAVETGQWDVSHDPPLRTPAPGAAALLHHLETTYKLVPAQAAGFSGYLLQHR